MKGPLATWAVAAVLLLLLLRMAACRTIASYGCMSKTTDKKRRRSLLLLGGATEVRGDLDIDHQLYSRQLFVYGLTAQRKLMNSKVLVYGSGPLAAEVVKNLAMAGVGTMTIIGSSGTGENRCSIKGENSDLSEYASALNPNLQVKRIEGLQTIDDLATDTNSETISQYDLCISCDNNIDEMERINAICRKNRVKMVGCYTVSVTGVIFNDFLEGFVAESVAGNESDNTKAIPLLSCSKDNPASGGVLTMTVSTIEEESLLTLVSAGDNVLIVDSARSDTDEALEHRVLQVVDKNTLKIEINSTEGADKVLALIGRKNASVRKAKKVKVYSHKSLAHILASGRVADFFSSYNGCLPPKKDRAISSCVLALLQTYEQQRAIDGLRNYDSFRGALLQRLVSSGIVQPLDSFKKGGVGAEILDRLAKAFCRSLRGAGGPSACGAADTVCHATVSVVGAIASQEALKAVSGLYLPVDQMLVFESLDSVYDYSDDRGDRESDERSTVYGSDALMDELRRLRLFVVGSGAIGCELLKTLAMMGACAPLHSSSSDGSGPWSGLEHGGIVLTDMDHIEKSNLNRQLLFRQRHVGQAKALVAAQMVREINPSFKVNAITKKLHIESESYFDSSFWDNVDVVLTALDNVDARRYVDEACVARKKWLIDSGTLGTKGNTQVVVPGVSESYSSSADPPEDSIPLCTLKSFPYHSDHCIAWGKAVFEQLFFAEAKAVKAVAAFVLSRISSEGRDDGGDREAVTGLVESLAEDDVRGLQQLVPALLGRTEPQVTRQQQQRCARAVFHRLFVADVQQLLREHPPESTDDEGAPFWGGSRRIPRSITAFDASDELHASFERHASSVLSRVFRCDSDAAEDNDNSSSSGVDMEGATVADMVHILCRRARAGDVKCLQQLQRLSGVVPETFEKDDQRDGLGHVDLVADLANLRSALYGLPAVTPLEVQRVAGKIVPALATTTSLVAGLVCLELVKVAGERVRARGAAASSLQNSRDKERLSALFRNSFVNLARPLFTYSQPVQAESHALRNLQTSSLDSFTLWSVLEPQSGKCLEKLTVTHLKKELKSLYGLRVTSVSYGDLLLYADFLPGAKESRALPLLRLVERALEGGDGALGTEGFTDDRGSSSSGSTSIETARQQGFVDLELVCEDAEGADARAPPYRVLFKKSSTKSSKLPRQST